MAVSYQDFVEAVARVSGTDVAAARRAAVATVAALSPRLDTGDRDRLRDALPPMLRDALEERPGPGPEGFVGDVRRLGHYASEQAPLHAQAVLAVLDEQEPDLFSHIHLPPEVDELRAPPAVGGGLTGPTGHAAPLTAEEVQAALRTLPDWSGDTHALRRTLVLPPGNLERVLERIRTLRRDFGRGPRITGGEGSVQLVVRTASVDAVTALDVELAARVDEVIADAAAGIGSPYGTP